MWWEEFLPGLVVRGKTLGISGIGPQSEKSRIRTSI
jgi:hypothetical protein